MMLFMLSKIMMKLMLMQLGKLLHIVNKKELIIFHVKSKIKLNENLVY